MDVATSPPSSGGQRSVVALDEYIGWKGGREGGGRKGGREGGRKGGREQKEGVTGVSKR